MTELSNKKDPSGLFGKRSVDIWQVLGGMASVAGVVITAWKDNKDAVSLWVITGSLGVVSMFIGILLLRRWGESGEQQTNGKFIIAVTVALIGATTFGLTGGIALYSTNGILAPDPTGPPDAGSTDSEVLRKGRLTIQRGQYVDLDSTSRDEGIMKGSKNGADLGFYDSVITSGRGGPGDIAVGSNLISLDDCSKTTVKNISFSTNDLVDGYTFCVRTTEARWARMTVTHRRPSDKPENDQIDFDILVWSKR